MDANGEEFGDKRLIETLSPVFRPPSAMVEHVLKSVRDFCQGAEQADDLTVLVAEFM